jgi:hypothetical protein
LKSVVGKRIKALRINCSIEKIFPFQRMQKEFNIKDENIYNMDEMGMHLEQLIQLE